MGELLTKDLLGNFSLSSIKFMSTLSLVSGTMLFGISTLGMSSARKTIS